MRPRVVLFGTGSPLSLAALSAAARCAEVVAVVTPGGPPLRGLRSVWRRLARMAAGRPLRRQAEQLGAPVVPAALGFERKLLRRTPDVLCVASFPRLLAPELLACARSGAIGLHPSLLPRHRGPDPLFWTYFHDDEQAGVTLHWLDGGEDTGDILYQEAVPLARARPVAELYAELARRGARLLEQGLEAIAAGRAPRQPQDTARATREPMPVRGSARVDGAAWSAERVLHVLGGLGSRYALLVADGSAQPLRVERARLLSAQPGAPRAGTVERRGGSILVHCRDGIVEAWPARSAAPWRALQATGWGRRATG
jgi:methionyl-tRNA formyltransferase